MKRHHDTQRGSALVYILIAIALLAALTVTFMEPSSQQATSQNTFETISELNTQANFVRSGIQECVLSYPGGDSTRLTAVNIPYPFNPTSTYLADADTDGNFVRNIRCPGNPGDSNDHTDIFSGTTGKFMPPPPNLFGEWMYFNDVDGVFFYIATDKSDAFLQTAMQKLDDQFAECEADVIDATGGDVSLTSAASDAICHDKHTCFRVWILARPSAENAYNGDTDGDEGSCP